MDRSQLTLKISSPKPCSAAPASRTKTLSESAIAIGNAAVSESIAVPMSKPRRGRHRSETRPPRMKPPMSAASAQPQAASVQVSLTTIGPSTP